MDGHRTWMMVTVALLGLFALPAAAQGPDDAGKGPDKRMMHERYDGKHGNRLDKLDADGSGAISLEEFTTGLDKPFEKMDENGDGKFDAADIDALLTQKRDKLEARLAKVDKNKDGTVTEEEFAAQAGDKFAKLDANGDGQIDKDEMKDMHKAFMEKMKDKRAGDGVPQGDSVSDPVPDAESE